MPSGRPGRLLLALAVLSVALASCANQPSYTEAKTEGEEIRFSIEDMKESVPQFYSLKHEGATINYLVLRIKGRVESYFDACAKCSPRKLGYRVQGDRLVCVACGQRYHLDDLSGVGSCYPIPLKGWVEGDSYVIEKDNIIAGKRYF